MDSNLKAQRYGVTYRTRLQFITLRTNLTICYATVQLSVYACSIGMWKLKTFLTQYKFPDCWKQLNYIIRVQISVGQVSYFLIPVVSSIHKINYKRSLFNFLKKTYTLSPGIDIFVNLKKPVLMMLVFINLITVSYHLAVLTGYYFFLQIKNDTKITNKLLILFFFLKFLKN